VIGSPTSATARADGVGDRAPGGELTDEELRGFARADRPLQIPRYVKFVDAFPMTVTGKVQKFKMRESAIQELGLQRAAEVATA